MEKCVYCGMGGDEHHPSCLNEKVFSEEDQIQWERGFDTANEVFSHDFPDEEQVNEFETILACERSMGNEPFLEGVECCEQKYFEV